MSSFNQQFPVIDPNNLDENYDIIFDYDSNGNLRRVRKERRYHGGGIITLLVILGVCYIVFASVFA
jgi:hypothetical protein